MTDPTPPESLAYLLTSGDRDRLHEALYDELKELARFKMSHERREHTLQATALVHEVYLRLSRDAEPNWPDRAHFFAAASEAMRRILIEHARRARRERRGGDRRRVTLGGQELGTELSLEATVDLLDALAELEHEDARAAAVVRLRFLAGLEVEAAARSLGVSKRSVQRDWRFAQAWLFDRLHPE